MPFEKGMSPNFWILHKKLSSTRYFAVNLPNDKTSSEAKISSNFE